jgi:hypothetical protein
MTVPEAAALLGIASRTVSEYAQFLKLPKKLVFIKGTPHRSFDLSDADVKAIATERRRRQHANSELRARIAKWMGSDAEITARSQASLGPERREQARKKAVRAAAEKRRRIRTWRENHDSDFVRKPKAGVAGSNWITTPRAKGSPGHY